jgi:RNA polymerase sigma factor (sigma-70 family)
MSSNPGGLLRAALRGLAALPPPDSDAELLERYVADRDEAAFTALVRRHGPMVLGVCRRRLGAGPDAEDAFQVAFMVLARDAKRIGNRESLPGWLYRVAYLVALKASGRKARHPAGPLHEQDAADRHDPHAEAVAGELRAALDAELSALPDKLRAVVVLCGLEQRTNAEAAKLLGCPTGTIDSRLSAARQKLRDRLARRGFLLATAAALEGLLRPPAVASSVSMLLLDQTVRGATGYAVAGGCAAEPLSTLADGVTPIMGSAKLKLLVAAGMSLALFGTASVGLYHADGQEKAKASAEAKKPDEPKIPQREALTASKPPAELTTKVAPSQSKTSVDVRSILAQPSNIRDISQLTWDTLIDQLSRQFGLDIAIDYAEFARLAPPDLRPGEQKIRLPLSNTSGMSIRDLLIQATVTSEFAFQIRGNQIRIVPAYRPPDTTGAGDFYKAERFYGPPIWIDIEEKPLPEILKDLRKQTGANIVLDTRGLADKTAPISAKFNDVRLFTVLAVLAEMNDRKVVKLNNVYYITSPQNATRLAEELPDGPLGGGIFVKPTPTTPAAKK